MAHKKFILVLCSFLFTSTLCPRRIPSIQLRNNTRPASATYILTHIVGFITSSSSSSSRSNNQKKFPRITPLCLQRSIVWDMRMKARLEANSKSDPIWLTLNHLVVPWPPYSGPQDMKLKLISPTAPLCNHERHA